MVRANRFGWSAGARALVKRSLQTAVLLAVATSVPAAWSAGRAPANLAAASTPNLHVKNVSLGSASFSSVGSITTVTTGSARTIINYQYLSVPSGDTLSFSQPSAGSRVFNRIDGNMPSAIDGTIKSNGIVYLVNPAGVMFGNGAVIQVGKFYAAAAHMTDNDFATGNDHFTDATGSVTNSGTIQAGEVHLVGAQVANFGQIISGTGNGGGIVTMTAGKDVYIGTTDSPAGSPHIMIKVSADTTTTNSSTGVTNTGTISAGEIRLGAGDLYAAGIYNSGTLKGQSITLDSGASTTITTGTVDASSATGTGGTIEILGDKVGVTGGSVTASGATGGGTVLIGGDAQGLGSTPTSQYAVIGSGASVDASATGSGAGGKLVVFAEDTTRVYGALSATGAGGGAGGYIETSGKQHFDISTAPLTGPGGTWLVDPNDIEITTATTTNMDSATGPTFAPEDDSAQLSVGLIQFALAHNTSVTVTTAHDPTLNTHDDQDGNITWDANAPLTYTTGGVKTLTLTAGGFIKLQAAIAPATPGTDSLSLVLSAGNNAGAASQDVTISANVSLGSGTFTSTGVGFSLTGAGSISASSASITHTGGAVFSGPVTTTGNISVSATSISGGGVLGGSNVSLTATTGGIGTSGAGNAVQASTTGTVTVSSAAGTGGDIFLQVDNNFSTTNLVFSSSGTGGAGQILSVASTNGLTVNSSFSGGADDVVLSGGTVTLTSGGVTTTGNISVTAGGNIVGGLGVLTAGNLTLTAIGGVIGSSGAPVQFVTAGSVTLSSDAGAGDIFLQPDNTVNFNTSQLVFTPALAGTGQNITVASANGLTLNSTITAGSDTVVLSGGTVTLNSGGVTTTGNISVTAGGNLVGGSAILTGGNVALTATAGIVGSSSPVQVVTAGNVTLSSDAGAGDISLQSDNASNFNTSQLVFAQALTGTANITVVSANGLTLNSTISAAGDQVVLTGGTVTLTSGGVTTTGNISVTAGGNLVGGSAILTGGNVALTATAGIIGSSSPVQVVTAGNVTLSSDAGAGDISLQSDNASNFNTSQLVFAPALAGTGQNITVASANGLTLNSTLSVGADNVVLSGGTVTLNSGGVTTTGNVSVTAGGNLVGGSGILTAGNVALTATAGVIGSSSPVQLVTAGSVTLSSDAGAGDISLQVDNAGNFNTSQMVFSPALTGTANLTVASANGLTLNSTISAAADKVALSGGTVTLTSGGVSTTGNISVTAGGNLVGGAGVLTAGNVALTATAGIIGSGSAVQLVTAGSVTLSSDAGAGDISLQANNASNFNTSQLVFSPALAGSGQNLTVASTHGLTLNNTISAGSDKVVLSGANVTLTSGGVTTTGNISVTAGTNLIGGAGVLTGANVALTATLGGIGASGAGNSAQVTTGGNVTLSSATGAAGDIFVQVNGAFSTSHLILSAGGAGQLASITSTGLLTVDNAVSETGEDLQFTGATLTVSGTGSISGANVTTATTGGLLTLQGNVTAASGDTLTVTAVGGGITQTVGTLSAPVGTIAINGAGAVALGGSAVTATTGTVTVTATGGSGAISGGNITAGNLSLTAGTTINLTGDAVGTLAAASNGTITFANTGALTVGTVGGQSNVTSTNNSISLTTTGALTLTTNVTAGTANATVSGTSISGTTGTVSGSNVSLTATTGDIGASGSDVNTSSTGVLTLSGANIFDAEAHAIAATDGTRLVVTPGTADTLDLSAPSIQVTTANFGDVTKPIILRSTSGDIETTSGSTILGSSVTLISHTGIGNASQSVNYTLGTGSLAVTASGAGIFLATSGAATFSTITTVSDTAGQTFALSANTISVDADLSSASALNVQLTTAAGQTFSMSHDLTAASVSLTTDAVSWTAGGFITGSGTVAIAPRSAGITEIDIGPGAASSGTVLGLDSGLLAASTASTLTVNGGSAEIVVGSSGAVNLSGVNYVFTLATTGQVAFDNLLTLPTGSTFTLTNIGGLTSNTGTGTALAIPGGTLVVVNDTGDIGGSPFFRTDVATLGNIGATGHISLWNNNDDLTISGTVTSSGTGSTDTIIADGALSVRSTGSVSSVDALDLQANGGVGLVIGGNVHAGGTLTLDAETDNVALNAGNVSTPGQINFQISNGALTQTDPSILQAGTVQIETAAGVSLAGAHNTFGHLSLVNFGMFTTTGAVVVDDTGTAGQALSIDSFSQRTPTGAATIVASGPVTQSSSIFVAAGGTLTVQTQNASGAAITLADPNNNLSGVTTTLQVLNASGNPSSLVTANVAFTNSNGPTSIQQIQSGASVTLIADAGITQAAGDSVGIHATSLTVTSDGATTLTNAHNDFSTLNVTDSSTGLLAYTTTASTNGSNTLTITGFTQSGAGSSNITNSSGAIASTANLVATAITLNAVKGISLTGANALTGVTANNSTSGNIVIDGGSATPLVITSISEAASGNTALTSGNGITINGNVSSGTSLGILVDVAGGTYTSGAAANLTSTGNITIIADQAVFTPGSGIHTTGTVTIEPFTGSEITSLGNGTATLNISNASLNSIVAPLITIGSANQTGNVEFVSDPSAPVPNALFLPSNVLIETAGSVDLSAAIITSATGASLTVQHDGTFSLGNASISGGLIETSFAGTGAGGAVTLSGPLTTADHAILFNSPVVLAGATTISTFGTTGGNITFGFSGTASLTSTPAGNALTLTAGSGNIAFASPVGSTGTPLGLLTVTSAGNVTLPTVNARGESLANIANLIVSAPQLLTDEGFLQSGAANVTLGSIGSSGNITTHGTSGTLSTIVLNGHVTLAQNTVLDTTNGGASNGSAITINGVVTGVSHTLTLTAGLGAVTTASAITTTGAFTSTGAAFTNSATITAGGISLTQSGAVNINGSLVGGSSNVSIGGAGGITTTASISGSNVTLAGGAVLVGGTVTTGGLFHSNGTTFTNTSTITSGGATIAQSGAVSIQAPLVDTGANVSITGSSVATLITGTIAGSNVTLIATSAGVGVGGAINASALFTSSGTTFTNTANITSVGANLTFSGAVAIDGSLAGGTGNVSVTGNGITSLSNGPISGATITLTGGAGGIGLNGNVTATGVFSASGATFSSNGTITSAGMNLTLSGPIVINGPVADAGSDVSYSGTSFTSVTAGTIAARNLTISVGTGAVAIGGAVTASGNVASTGGTFINTAPISGATITLTQSGAATFNAALSTGSGNLLVNAAGIQSNANGVLTAGTITLASTGAVNLLGQVNGSGNVSTSGTTFAAAGINGLNIAINQTGAAMLNGNLDANSGNGVVTITSAGLQQNNGIIQASQLGVNGAGSNAVTLTDANQVGILAANIPGGSLQFTNAVPLTVGTAGNPSVVGITTTGPVTLATSGGLTISQAISAGSGAVQLTVTGGDVTVNAPVTTSSTFTSSGANFTNTATITASGVTLSHSGFVTINGAIAGGSNFVTIGGNGIISNGSGAITGGAISLAGGNQTVSLGGSVTGSGLFTSTGAAFTNTAPITSAGASITGGNLVTINAPLVDAGNDVTINGVGITTGANGTIAANNVTLTANSGDVTLGGAVNANGTFASSGINFTNTGVISANGVSLTHPGVVTIGNTIAANGGALSITGASSIADAGSALSGTGVTLHASGTVNVGSTLTANSGAALLTSDGSGVNVGGALTGGSASVVGTTVTVASVATTGGAIVLTGPSGVTLNGNVNAGTSPVTITGPATLGGNDTITGGTVTFTSTISGSGKALTVNSPGVTTFGGDIGSSGSPLASLATDAVGSTTLHGSIFTSGVLAVNDPLTLGANSTVSGGTVTFANISGGGTFSLAVTSTTSSTFAGTVGAGTDNANALTTLQVGGGTATFASPTITTTGSQTYSAPVVFTGPASLGGSTFSFTNTVNSGSSPETVAIAATGPVSFGAVVGGTSPLQSLAVTGATATTLNHAITTVGNMSFSGPITISTTLISTSGGVSLPGVVTLTGATSVTAGGSGGIVFGTGGTITGDDNLTLTSNAAGSKTLVGQLGTGSGSGQRLGNVTFDSAGVVGLGGNIFATNLKFAYKDGGAAPTLNPTVATIYYAKGDLTINTSGTFDMEQNQSLSVFAAPASAVATFGTSTGNGSLTIDSNNHAITLGDVAAQGILTVNAGVTQTITIRARSAAQVLQADGSSLSSQQTGIVSGLATPGALVFTGSITVLSAKGANDQVAFSAGAASVDIADKANLRLTDSTKIVDFNRTDVISAAKFFTTGANGQVLEVAATGVGIPPQNQVNVVPRDVQTLEPERAAAISGALADALFQLGIAARDTRTDELIEYLVGAALYDDVPYTLDAGPEDTKIASSRLPYAPVIPTVQAYQALFFKPELDANGKPVLDDKGKPKMIAQTSIITNTLGETWGMYHRDPKSTPAGFRAYLETHQKDNPKDVAALSYLNQLRDLLYQIQNLGLTANEYERSEKVLLGKVRPASIGSDAFLTAIMGPSTLTKNMTAMK
jgi:filamentous hemagglutinin family protein